MNNENLFSQTYDQIVSKALGGGTPYFQMIGNPKDFSWSIPPTGQMSPQAYQVISGMPLWSPIGGYTPTDARFFNAYRQVLSHVTFKISPERQHDLQKLIDEQTKANNALVKAESDMNQAYLTAKQNGGAIFEAKYPEISDWIESKEGQAYQKAIDTARANFEKRQDFVLQFQKASMPMELQEAMDAITMPTGDPASSTAPRGWTKVPDGAGILRWQPEWKIETTGQDWRALLSEGSIGAFSVELKASDSTSNLNKSWAGGTAGYDTFFWGVNVAGAWKKMDLTKADKSVTATISVQSSTKVQVNPGDWYDGGFMKALAKGTQGPTGEGYTILSPWVAKGGPGSSSLFGQYGILSTRVSELLVVYKPSFEVTMKESTFKKYHEKFDASGGFRIGPFHFGGRGGHESDYIHSTSGGTTFKGESTSEDPLIIGAVVAFPGVDAP